MPDYSYATQHQRQGRNERKASGAQFPGCRIIMGALNHCAGRQIIAAAQKSLKNVTSIFFNTVNLLL